MATESQKSVEFELQLDVSDDEFLGNIDFHLVETLMEKEKSQSDDTIVSLFENAIPSPLTTVENRMLRADSMNITTLASEAVRQPEASRFVSSTSFDVDSFITENENKNTQLKTKQDLNLIHSYLASQAEFRQIHEIPPDHLCEFICGFLYSVRKKDGGEYEPVSLRAFVSSFERHLKNKKYGFSIIKDDVFHRCREFLKAKTKDLKSKGKGNKPNAATAISDQEVEMFYDTKQLGDDNARSLQNTMWYIFISQFGMRPGVEIKNLCWGDIEIGCDPDGTEFLIYKQERQTKTRTGLNPRDVRKVKPRAYETPENPSKCPVRLYKLYASKRPVEMNNPDSPFFLVINAYPKKDGQWYKKSAMGINKIYAIMKEMKENAGIAENKKLTPYRCVCNFFSKTLKIYCPSIHSCCLLKN